MPNCLFCESANYRSSVYQDTLFNNKVFQYIKCSNCNLVYVCPLPNEDDLTKMYPIEYQGDLITVSSEKYNDLLQKIKTLGEYTSILDYGCGGGRFVIEAMNAGYDVTGTEYNPKLIASLNAAFPKAKFYSVNDFEHTTATYDVIFLSNVLEHLTNPKAVMNLLKSKLAPNGIFIIEGPVEHNINLTSFLLKLLFFIRKRLFNKKVNHAPLHIFYSNYYNQEFFFKSFQLKTLFYQLGETPWPFPMYYRDCDTFLKKVMFLWANCSMLIGKLFPFWGNNFVYIGQLSEKSKTVN